MLDPKNEEKALKAGLFADPTCEYRGTPFWAWNARLDAGELKRQIDVMKQMGLGGFHMHVRTGMATPYLSHEFMELIHTCVEKARDNLASLESKLSNEKFVSRAPENVVNAEREKAQKARDLIAQLEQSETALKKL